MAKSIKVKPKKRGRPATGKDPLYGVRFSNAQMLAIEKWAKQQGVTSRSEAIRRLVEEGLMAIKRVGTSNTNKPNG